MTAKYDERDYTDIRLTELLEDQKKDAEYTRRLQNIQFADKIAKQYENGEISRSKFRKLMKLS